MKNPIHGAALLALLLMSASSLAASPEPMTKAVGPSTLSGDDVEFLQEAAQTAMLEAQAASLASTRALAPATRDFANSLSREHKAATLKALAASKGVVLPARLDAERRGVLARLKKVSPGEFDKRYAEAMREGHHDAIELFKETAEESKDAEIRAYAGDTLPELQHDLAVAKGLKG